MKNIHVLPTPNPSRLVKQKYDTIDRLCLADIATKRAEYKRFNLYITSDEEIKEDYVITYGVVIKVMMFDKETLYFVNGTKAKREDCKKIIITDNQDLIKDGVQAIDDDFLKWLVKNSSCEEVEVQKWFDGVDFTEYKIIIPKEEPKQDWFCPKCDSYVSSESVTFEETHQLCNTGIITKQETLEEAAERTFNIPDEAKGNVYFCADIAHSRRGFMQGAKWQQERSYSEQEVFNLLMDFWMEKKQGYKTNPQCVANWFEQFKKK